LSWNKSSFIAAADIQVYSSEKKKVIGVIEEYSPSNQQLDVCLSEYRSYNLNFISIVILELLKKKKTNQQQS